MTQSEQGEFCLDPCGASAQRLVARIVAKLRREGDQWTGKDVGQLLQWVLESRDFRSLVQRSLACGGAVQDSSDGHSLVERLQQWLQLREDSSGQRFWHVAGDINNPEFVDLQDIAAEESENV